MSGVSIDTFNASFIKYLPGVIEILNRTTLAKKLTKGSVKKWEGSQLLKNVHVSRNGGINFIVDGGAIPPAGKQSYQPVSAWRKFTSGHVYLTDGILGNAKTTNNASIRVVDSELRGLMEGIRKFQNYFWTRDGTGVVTLMSSVFDGTAVFYVDDARGLWDGVTYTTLDTDGSTVHDTWTVSKVSRAYDNTNLRATVTATASKTNGSEAADDYVVWGSGAYSSYNKALTGLDAGIDDAAATFQNLNCSIYPRYTSPVLDNSGTPRELTPLLLRQMLAMLVQEGEKAQRTMTVVGNVWSCIKFDELYESAVRITPDTKTVGSATPTFQSSFGSVKIEQDPDAPYGKLFFIDPTEITHAVQRELAWRVSGNSEGSIFQRTDQFAGYSATALETSELFYERRNRCGKIEDLSETVMTAY